jgi:hypothetical protein
MTATMHGALLVCCGSFERRPTAVAGSMRFRGGNSLPTSARTAIAGDAGGIFGGEATLDVPDDRAVSAETAV